jgi:hypothetical protein
LKTSYPKMEIFTAPNVGDKDGGRVGVTEGAIVGDKDGREGNTVGDLVVGEGVGGLDGLYVGESVG